MVWKPTVAQDSIIAANPANRMVIQLTVKHEKFIFGQKNGRRGNHYNVKLSFVKMARI